MDERAWPEVEPETQSAMRAVLIVLTSFDALGDEIFHAACRHQYDGGDRPERSQTIAT